jgi:hypothetical protein
LCVERYTTFEGKLFGVSKTAYVCFFGSSNLFSNPTTGLFSNAWKNNNINSKFKYFFEVFGSAEGKEVRVASAGQRRSEGGTSRGGGGGRGAGGAESPFTQYVKVGGSP